MSYTEITGGVTAAHGFLAGSAYCGIKAGNVARPDIALIHTMQPAVAVGTFTTNRVKAAPVRVSMMNVRTPDVRAIITNAGNANACTGVAGIENAKRMTRATARLWVCVTNRCWSARLGASACRCPLRKWRRPSPTLPRACMTMAAETRAGDHDQRHVRKGTRVELNSGWHTHPHRRHRQGRGHDRPNMATMLCFLTPTPRSTRSS
jgi:glutamate N-acetyltransferase/amino-acid N-acetyltransferase